MNPRRAVASAFCIVVLAVAFAPCCRAEGLFETYQLAKRNDPQIQIAEATLHILEARVPEARAALLPQLNATGSEEHNRDRTSFTDVPPEQRKFRQYQWTVQLTQPVVQLDALFAYREANALRAQAFAQYSAASQDLMLRTAQAYFAVLQARDNIDAAQRQEAAAMEQMAVAEKGFKTGTHAVTDAYEARAKAASAKAQRISASNDLSKAITEVEKITGTPFGDIRPLLPDVVIPSVRPLDVKQWTAQAGDHNPAVLAARAAFQAANEEIRKNRSDHLPTVALIASYGANYAGAVTNNPTDFSSYSRGKQAGFQVSVPLFSGGGTNAKVIEALAGRDKASAEVEGARRQAIADAKEAYSSVESGLALVDSLQIAVESGENAVVGNEKGYRLGIRINSDVLAAQHDLYATRRDLSKARLDVLFQGLKLKAAAGALSESDLAELDYLFQRPGGVSRVTPDQ